MDLRPATPYVGDMSKFLDPSIPPRFRFPSERPALDLLATVGARGAGKNVEKLHSPADLAAWFVAAGIIDQPTDALTLVDLEAARTLREAIHRLLTARLAASPWEDADVSCVNLAATAPPPVPVLEKTSDQPGVGIVRRVAASGGVARSCLAAVAVDAIDVLGRAEDGRLKACANPVCRTLFLDLSRPGLRRWCSMTDGGCGNRAKTRAIRSRRALEG